ncbi:hypothetical protein HGA13_16130 [Nocardia speluncae]|uniref:DUF6286 domain-containing protein n=1 Tax=Nocardia speluncae TaxID=419477 RepID=A0A846XDX3_9NOCA|nr:DUF6286 domain-containing protein [Nocardia speluncae]NKY34591.1 hypothetical protein [Nocardia speluncae]
MIRRSRRTLPAVLVALVLAAVCVAVIVSLAQRAAGAPEYLSYDTVARELHATTWGEWPVLVAALVLLTVGALLLVAAVLPGRPRLLPLHTGDGMDTGVPSGDLRALLRDDAATVHGVNSARISLRRGTVRAVVDTDLHRGHTKMADEVCAVLSNRIQELGPPLRRVQVRVKSTEKVAGGRRAAQVAAPTG